MLFNNMLRGILCIVVILSVHLANGSILSIVEQYETKVLQLQVKIVVIITIKTEEIVVEANKLDNVLNRFKQLTDQRTEEVQKLIETKYLEAKALNQSVSHCIKGIKAASKNLDVYSLHQCMRIPCEIKDKLVEAKKLSIYLAEQKTYCTKEYGAHPDKLRLCFENILYEVNQKQLNIFRIIESQKKIVLEKGLRCIQDNYNILVRELCLLSCHFEKCAAKKCAPKKEIIWVVNKPPLVEPNLDSVNQQQQIKQLQELNELTKKIEESGDYSSLAVPVEAVDEDELSLYIYTKAQPAGTEIKLRNANVITQVSPFNTELKTIIYFHGWLDSFDSDHCILVRNAVLEAADVNIIMVNWDKYSKTIDYIESAANVAEIGKYVAEFILNVVETYSYSLSDITVVGHSLGAHIAGHVGKNTNGALGMIVGLDPAGPLFFKDIRSGRLTEDDAQYVHAIHTNAGVAGVTYSVGDSDFWPNGGAFQPCLTCSHNDAFRYYAESITNNLFFSRQCDSYDNFQDGKCSENPKSMMGGINIDTSAAGNYYLKTNSESPYGMGDIVYFNKHN